MEGAASEHCHKALSRHKVLRISINNCLFPVINIYLLVTDTYNARQIQGTCFPCKSLVSQAIRIFPRAHARGKGGGGKGRTGKMCKGSVPKWNVILLRCFPKSHDMHAGKIHQ